MSITTLTPRIKNSILKAKRLEGRVDGQMVRSSNRGANRYAV